MSLKIVSGCTEEYRVVTEIAQASIAVTADQTSKLSRCVVVVNVQLIVVAATLFWGPATDCTESSLQCCNSLELYGRDAVNPAKPCLSGCPGNPLRVSSNVVLLLA
jgi:hypothetical protein